MCGITGFLYQKQQNWDATMILSSMTSLLSHRGPNDAGIWLDKESGIAFGHRRLSILDLSGSGHQPMHTERYALIYNGEIYNFLDLRRQLAKEVAFKSRSDTEVILALVTKCGIVQALTQLRGMFAFALWDKQEKTLHLARDRIGEKPLYYGLVNGTFVFGSELKAIRAFPNFNNDISRESVRYFLHYGYIPAPYSIYEKIHKLLPGTYLSISNVTLGQSFTPISYWSAINMVKAKRATTYPVTDADAIKHTHLLLQDAVKNCMVSDVSIGTMLSGGIDSSLITALMQSQSNRPIKTFTIGFHTQGYNEAPYAARVAKQLQTDHHSLYITETEALVVLPKLATMYDEPFADSSAIPSFLVCQLAQQHVKVCLSGDGGDEVFGGYNRYLLGNRLWQKMARFPAPVRKMIQKAMLYPSSSSIDRLLKWTPFSMAGAKFQKAVSVLGAQSEADLYQHLIAQWLDPSLILTTDLNGNIPFLLMKPLECMDFIEQMMLTDTLSYLPDDILVKVDRASMANSLEIRAPYLDHSLIEWVWQLPLVMKIRQSESKWLLRQLLATYLPQTLFERPKMGFAIPLADWLRGPLREWAEHLLHKPCLVQSGFFKADSVIRIWHEHLSGKRNWQYQLWTVLMFQAWQEKERCFLF